MSWFSDQIRQREESDQNVLEDSFSRMASVVMNKWDAERLADERLTAKEAIDDILKFYHQKPADIPENIGNAEGQLDYALRQSGLMVRDVELEENWHRDTWGPMLGYLKDSGAAVALLPGTIYGYYYKDPATGRKIRVNRKTEKLLAREALCFYQPLPMKKLGIPDLLLFMKNSVSASDFLLLALAALAVTLVGFIEPQAYSMVTGPILKTRNMSLLTGVGVYRRLRPGHGRFFRFGGHWHFSGVRQARPGNGGTHFKGGAGSDRRKAACGAYNRKY